MNAANTLIERREGGGWTHLRCGGQCVEYAGSMYFRGRFFAGILCKPCNALFDNPDDSMLAYAASWGNKPYWGDESLVRANNQSNVPT